MCSESVSGELVKAGVDCLDEGERSASLRGPAKFTKTVALKRLFHGALVHESELARNEPDSQVHHLPRAYDDGLPSSAIRLRM